MNHTLFFLVACVAWSSISFAQKKDSPSEAIGFYSSGKLLNPVDIVALQSTRIHKLFLQRNRYYTTNEMANLLVGLSTFIQELDPNSEKLQIGDLSNRAGGKADGHASHQNGLDADVVYMTHDHRLQKQGADYWDEWFVDKKQLTNNFDLERNWYVMKWLGRQSQVRRIFVDSVIKDALCRHAASLGEMASEARTLRTLSREDATHKTHFHIRIACPAGDVKCKPQADPTEIGCPK